jgi:hypothetical protein
MMDPSGVVGSVLSYAMTVAFAGSAFFVFLYLWKKGSLGIDEDASLEMMKQQEETYE